VSNGHDHGYEAGVDREISLKGIVWTGVVLTIVVIISGAAMLFMSRGLKGSMISSDPPPPVLLEAQTQEPPPDPRLQVSPEEDMRLMRAEEEAALNGYGWVDEPSGIARVPIARAMEMVANGEVPSSGAPATPAAPAEAAPAEENDE
jgi:hypothetical protein